MSLIDVILILLLTLLVSWLVYYIFLKKNKEHCGGCTKCSAFSKKNLRKIIKEDKCDRDK